MHFVSFSTIKAIVSKPKKPIPALEELLFELIISVSYTHLTLPTKQVV